MNCALTFSVYWVRRLWCVIAVCVSLYSFSSVNVPVSAITNNRRPKGLNNLLDHLPDNSYVATS